MKRKAILILSNVFLILLLTGCFDWTQEVWHYPDGSGRFVMEMVLLDENFSQIMEEEFGITDEEEIMEFKEEFLDEFSISEEDLSLDQANIKEFRSESFIDAESGDIVSRVDYELFEMAGFNAVDGESEESSEIFWVIEDNNDGTYRFSYTLNSADMFMEEGTEEYEETELLFGSSVFKLQFHTPEFIMGDPLAVYDAQNEVVVWEMPLLTLLSSQPPVTFFAVYRLEPLELEPTPTITETIEPEIIETAAPQALVEETPTEILEEDSLATEAPEEAQDEGGFQVPNWLLYALGGLLCLSAVIVVVVVVVVLILRRRKKK